MFTPPFSDQRRCERQVNRKGVRRRFLTYDNTCAADNGGFGVEMDSPPGRTWVGPPWPRRQYPFYLSPARKHRHLRHSALGPPPRMVGLLRSCGYSGRGARWLSDLPAGREGWPADLGKKSWEAARRKNLQPLREARLHHGVHRLYPSAAVPFYFRGDDRRSHAIPAKEALVCTYGRARNTVLCCGLFGQNLRQADNRILLAALPNVDVFLHCPRRNGRHLRPLLLHLVPTQGT